MGLGNLKWWFPPEWYAIFNDKDLIKLIIDGDKNQTKLIIDGSIMYKSISSN